MKSSDIKIGNAYPYHPQRLGEGSRNYYTPTCVVPLLKQVHHTYDKKVEVPGLNGLMSPRMERVMEPGRKALGYGTDYYNHAGKPYIEACGVPCMVANRQGPINSTTTWSFKLIDPRLIWDSEWSIWQTLIQEKLDKQEAERKERAEAKRLLDDAVVKATTVLTDLAPTVGGKVQVMFQKVVYGGTGIQFNTTEQLEWLAALLLDYIELNEEVKDLRYELED